MEEMREWTSRRSGICGGRGSTGRLLQGCLALPSFQAVRSIQGNQTVLVGREVLEVQGCRCCRVGLGCQALPFLPVVRPVRVRRVFPSFPCSLLVRGVQVGRCSRLFPSLREAQADPGVRDCRGCQDFRCFLGFRPVLGCQGHQAVREGHCCQEDRCGSGRRGKPRREGSSRGDQEIRPSQAVPALPRFPALQEAQGVRRGSFAGRRIGILQGPPWLFGDAGRGQVCL